MNPNPYRLSRLLDFLPILIAFLPPILRAVPLSTPSTISAVEVYRDRAVVTRVASVDLADQGVIEVALEGIPSRLAPESVQVSARGTAQATILDVTSREVFAANTPNDRAKLIEAQLRALHKERRSLEDRAKLLETQRSSVDFAEGALLNSTGRETSRPTVAEATGVLAFTQEQRTRIAAELATLDEQRTDLAAKIAAIERQLAELRVEQRKSTAVIAVRLDVATRGKLDLTVSYMVAEASWAPSYDLRANSNEKTIAVSYHGSVSQRTGEDWKNVTLTLSTAQPSLGGAAPSQTPWEVSVVRSKRERPDPAATVLGQGAGKLSMMPANDAFSRSKGDEANFGGGAPVLAAQATLDQAATSASFKITTPASIPTDGSSQRVPITAFSLAATPEYAAAPKLQAAAFLTAKVTNTSDYPLLSGPMHVFLDGTFVAVSELATVMAGEKFDLALGADEGIAVKHKRVQRFAEDMGLTGRGRRLTYEYLISVQNNKKTPVRLVVSDQIPLSRDEKIVVKQLAPDTKDMKPDVEGTIKWVFELKAGEKRELPLKFSIDYPGNVGVAGL